MAQVYLVAAPGDTAHGEALAAWLKQRGFRVRTDYGKFQYPPLRGDEVLVMLWSRKALMSVKMLFLVNRGIDAWTDGRLVLAKLDHGLKPRGLGDVEMVDLAFEPAREHRYADVAKAVRAIAAPPEPAGGPGGLIIPETPDQDAERLFRKRASADADADERAIAGGIIMPDLADEAVSAAPAPAGPSVFVSYASANKDTVWPIVERVEELGVDVWLDRDDIQVGQNWAGAIVRAIKTVSKVALMCSEAAFQSDHVRREIYLADKDGKALVPVRLDGAEMPEDFEYFLVDKQWLDAGELSGPGGEAVLREVFSG
ncbi:MAG: toll/interleukin-1 receptor domain-containing protein [Pseudomonadota bacterium]